MDWETQLREEQIIWQYPGQGAHAEYLLSQKHSNFYFNSDALADHTELFEMACISLCNLVKLKIKEKPDWIITYPPFGLKIGKRLAELIGCKFASVILLDDWVLPPDVQTTESVLCCADDLYTGNSLQKLLKAAKKAKILPPLIVIGNFSGNDFFEGHEIISLIQKQISLWDRETCPLCAKGSPALPARRHFYGSL